MRYFMKWAVALMVAGGLGLASASAADKPAPTPEDMFKRLDKDSDGKLSAEEFVGKKTGEDADKAKKLFAKMDKNSDGSVDLEEFKAARAKKK
jgi:Ca2+-binding EF-hand superfamily protein